MTDPKHGQFALTIGSKRPAMSVSWEPTGFIIFFADLFPGDQGFDDLPAETVCLHCLLEDGDWQLGRGLDLAKQWGRCNWDVEAGEWYFPDDAEWWGEL